ncbi:MAG: Uma2 family endonuclease [Deltaproteobacteria bacterium]|nr:Uma2 family endonuclease [Deltaproteobacteria bacterium]
MVSTAATSDAQIFTEGFPITVYLRPVVELTDDQFFEFCQINRDLRIERTARGELLIMPPTGWETSGDNAEITMQLRVWAKRDGTGTSTDSSGGFKLPNGATRSPDAAWITHSRLAALTAEQRKKFLPLCPDFALELRSPTDSLTALQAKMQEYLDNGARLGWLIDPEQRRVYVYRPQTPIEILENPETVSGDPVLPGFILDLREIW